jgi:general secretion pathway protein G
MKKRENKHGFTLIELMLVMVILAVLAAVVVPKFTKRSQQAKETAAKTDIANLEIALDAFEIDTGRYPTNSEGISALIRSPANVEDDWKGPYLKRGIPKDPWGTEYMYKQPGQYNEFGYDLYSYGPDGISGTEDDIKNWTEDQLRRTQ